MHEFIAALRQLQRPLVLLAAAILVLQTLVAGLAGGDTAARIATFGADVGHLPRHRRGRFHARRQGRA